MREYISLVEAFALWEQTELPMDGKSRAQRAKQLGFTVPAFHGTTADFHEFSLDYGKANRGGGHAPNFTNEPGEASGYADVRATNGEPSNVIPVLLRIKKPFVIDGMKKTLNSKQFFKLSGGVEPYFKSDKYSTRDVMDAMFKEYRSQTDDTKEVWNRIYAYFQGLGYDCFLFKEVPRDYYDYDDNDDAIGPMHHEKIVVFNPKNVRSRFAVFDPTKSESANLLA